MDFQELEIASFRYFDRDVDVSRQNPIYKILFCCH